MAGWCGQAARPPPWRAGCRRCAPPPRPARPGPVGETEFLRIRAGLVGRGQRVLVAAEAVVEHRAGVMSDAQSHALVPHHKAMRGSPPRRRAVATVMPWTAEALAQYLQDVRPRCGAPSHPALWLTERGGRISARSVDKRFAAWRAAAGLPGELSVHCLRHSYVSYQFGCRGAAAGRARGGVARGSADHDPVRPGPRQPGPATRPTSWRPTSRVPPGNPRGLGLFRLAAMAVRRKVSSVIGHRPQPQPEREPPFWSALPARRVFVLTAPNCNSAHESWWLWARRSL